jgi:hypothetical protein
MSTPPSAQQLLDTFLLGMTWLREDRPDILARPGSSIFSAVRLAGVISEGQRKTLAGNSRLITLAMQNGEIIKGAKKPPKQQLVRRIATSDKYLLTLVTDGSVQYAKLFGGRGYQHVITEAGMAYARTVAPNYARLLNREKFNHAWGVFKTQMRARGAQTRQPGRPMGGAVVSDDEQNVRITREAQYGEDDFEW